MPTYFYCYANGVAKFHNHVPDGAIMIDAQSAAARRAEIKKINEANRAGAGFALTPQTWRERLTARCRLAYDNKTLLIPGIPEAADQNEGLAALERFKAWAVK